MERKDQFIGWVDILQGVGELAVDEAKMALQAIFRMPRQLASHGDHPFIKVTPENVDTLLPPNRWDDCGRDIED